MSATHRTKEERLDSSDKYYTPPGLARACIRALIVDGWVRYPFKTKALEPSVGRGAWVAAMLQHDFECANIWINDLDLSEARRCLPMDSYQARGMHVESADALKLGPFGWDLITGNPPFNDAGSHIEVGLASISAMGILAYLMPIGWFTARGKQDSRISWLKTDAKPAHRYLISPRPSFSGDGSDSATYTYTVWAPGAKGRGTTESILDWFDDREEDRQLKKSAT